MITKKQYEFLKERLNDAKRDGYCTAECSDPCEDCPLDNTGYCPSSGQDSIDKITKLMKEYEEVNMSAEGFEITKEDYDFLKRQK